MAKFDKCGQCGAPLLREPGRGKAKKYCGEACQQAALAERVARKTLAQCSVNGCDQKANRVGAKLCERHYIRLRRNGTTAYVGVQPKPGDREHSGGYVLQAAKGHPRALGGYRAYQHRVVFTQAHGEGPFECHWCSKPVAWEDGKGMHVDHLDGNPKNNSAANLVASCPPCNKQRGHEKIRRTMRERYAQKISAFGRTLTVGEWAAELGIARQSLKARLARWPIERALTEARGNTGPRAA